MSSSLHPMAAELGRFVFHGFIAVADADDALGPREVERLHQIVSDPPPSAAPALRAALESLRDQYAELWKSYRAGSVGKAPGSVASHWMTLRPRLDGTEATQLTEGLLACLEEVVRAGSPVLARLGLGAGKKARALAEIRSLLSPESAGAPAASPVESPPPAPASVGPERDCLWPATGLAVSSAPVWVRGKTRVRCVEVVLETHDVRSFHFVAEPQRLFTYKPGQFVTLELPIEGRTVRRSYTISSSPSRPYTISVTVKRVDGGLASNWLHDNVTPGVELNLSGPNGDFTCVDWPAPRLLLIAGGSGVTPVMSMLRWLADTASPCDVVFLDFVRTPDDVVFSRELRQISARMGSRLRLGVLPSRLQAGHSWNGPTGRVAEAVLRFYAPDFAERETFVCGPGGFMEFVRTTLAAAGQPRERYHEESFGGAPTAPRAPEAPRAKAAASAPVAPPAAASARPAGTAVAAAEGEIVFAKSGKTVKCSSDDAILDVAEANGIAMVNSCRSGTCGTCKTRKIEGTVHLDDQRALSEEDLAAGFVLACVGRAEGRVVIEA